MAASIRMLGALVDGVAQNPGDAGEPIGYCLQCSRDQRCSVVEKGVRSSGDAGLNT
jgi:hypothetical protein